jgi:hypothetical protein
VTDAPESFLPPFAGDEPEPGPDPGAENAPEPEPEPELSATAFAALSYGWTKFRENVGPMLIVAFVALGAPIVLAVAERVLVTSVARWFLLQVVGLVVGSVAGLGLVRMALMLSAGEEPDVGRALRYDRWGAWIGFSVVFGVVEGVGLVLCVFPGLLFLAYFGLAPYFFVDRAMSVRDALRASRHAVVSQGLAFPVLLTLVVGALGFVAAGVGVFVTAAVAALGLAFVYRGAAGESVAP